MERYLQLKNQFIKIKVSELFTYQQGNILAVVIFSKNFETPLLTLFCVLQAATVTPVQQIRTLRAAQAGSAPNARSYYIAIIRQINLI